MTVREDSAAEARAIPGQARTRTVRLSPATRLRHLFSPGIRSVQLALLAALLAAWEIGGRDSAPYTLSPPSKVVTAADTMIRSGELPHALLFSAETLLLGFGLANVLGVAFGYAMGWSRPLGRTLDPFVAALYVVPIASLVPVLIVWLGFGTSTRVLVVFLFAVFEPLLNAATGVRAVPHERLDVARTFGASRLDLLVKVVFPDTLPIVLTGVRMAASRAIKGMVLSEMLFATSGLGGLIVRYAGDFRTDRSLVAVVTVTLLGVALTGTIHMVERRALAWRH